MAHQTFPKPVKAKKVPNRTVSKARAARRRKDERLKNDVYRVVDLRDSFYCRVCRKSLFTSDVHHHHIVFRSQGGEHSTANVVTLCTDCHDDVHQRRLWITGNADETLTITREAPCPSSN